MTTESPWETHVGQEECVTANPTQADQELQGDPQVVAPFLIVGECIPSVLHFRPRHLIPILQRTKEHAAQEARGENARAQNVPLKVVLRSWPT